MGLITDFYNRLKHFDQLNALIGGRIYALYAPDKIDTPYCEFSQISSNRKYTHGGYAGAKRTRIQVNCYAKTYEVAKNVAAQVTSALETWSKAEIGAVFQENEVDMFDSNTGLFFVPVDFIIWYQKQEGEIKDE